MVEKISIYTDGSCLGNPGPGGWAAIYVDSKGKIVDQIFGHEFYTTNNRMEISAIIESLRHIKSSPVNRKLHEIDIFSDSNLLVQTINSGWKKKKNLDLWRQLDENSKGLLLRFHWVKAHHIDKYNLKVDKIALAQAKKAQSAVHENPELAAQIIQDSSVDNNLSLF